MKAPGDSCRKATFQAGGLSFSTGSPFRWACRRRRQRQFVAAIDFLMYTLYTPRSILTRDEGLGEGFPNAGSRFRLSPDIGLLACSLSVGDTKVIREPSAPGSRDPETVARDRVRPTTVPVGSVGAASSPSGLGLGAVTPVEIVEDCLRPRFARFRQFEHRAPTSGRIMD